MELWEKSITHPSFPVFPVPPWLKHIVRPDYVGTGLVPEWPDYIEINNQEQIQGLARACQLARHVLLLAAGSLKVSTSSLQYCSVGVCVAWKTTTLWPMVCLQGWDDNRWNRLHCAPGDNQTPRLPIPSQIWRFPQIGLYICEQRGLSWYTWQVKWHDTHNLWKLLSLYIYFQH